MLTKLKLRRQNTSFLFCSVLYLQLPAIFAACYTFSSQQCRRGKEACSSLSCVAAGSSLGFSVSWQFLCLKHRAARQGPFQPKNSMVQLKNINDVHFRYYLWPSLREKCLNFNFLILTSLEEKAIPNRQSCTFYPVPDADKENCFCFPVPWNFLKLEESGYILKNYTAVKVIL